MGGRLKCLLISPADPLTRRPRAGPMRRLQYPPPGVEYRHVTDHVSVPTSTGRYTFSPVNVGMAAVKFALEHAFPIDQSHVSMAHTFFWDVRRFTVPWIYESDQSLGQYLIDYNNIRGRVGQTIKDGYSTYLNSRGCTAVVTWTHWAKRGFEEDGVDPGKVFVVPPPFEAFSSSLPHQGCNVLFIGRDFVRKGGDVTLKAFASIDAPDCKLTFVGKAAGRALDSIRADRRITYFESATNRVLSEEIWPQADILALPTRADAFAMTVVEAMSRGVPVVTTSIPSISEAVEDGVSGFLVPPGDAVAFGERLSRLAGDASLRSRMGDKAQERVRALFSPKMVGQKLLEVYRHAP